MDSLGHVNNVTYVDYLQEARVGGGVRGVADRGDLGLGERDPRAQRAVAAQRHLEAEDAVGIVAAAGEWRTRHGDGSRRDPHRAAEEVQRSMGEVHDPHPLDDDEQLRATAARDARA